MKKDGVSTLRCDTVYTIFKHEAPSWIAQALTKTLCSDVVQLHKLIHESEIIRTKVFQERNNDRLNRKHEVGESCWFN